jgi:hypothetical protein
MNREQIMDEKSKIIDIDFDCNNRDSVEKSIHTLAFMLMIISRSISQMFNILKDKKKASELYLDQQIYLSTGLDMFHFLVSALDNINDNIKNDPQEFGEVATALSEKFNKEIASHYEKRNKYGKSETQN